MLAKFSTRVTIVGMQESTSELYPDAIRPQYELIDIYLDGEHHPEQADQTQAATLEQAPVIHEDPDPQF